MASKMIASAKGVTAHAHITFDLSGTGTARDTEELLGEPLGGDDYRIVNIPFKANTVSYGDVVRASHEGRKMRFEEILSHSGHSTFRLRIEWALIDQVLENYWTPFELMGCTYEGKKGSVFQLAMDVPPEADLAKIESLLEKGKKAGVWQFERGYVAE